MYGIFKPLLRDVEGFLRAISEVLWCQEGDNWLLLCRLRGGAFVYFTAWFDSQGGMCLYAADSREVLVAMAMTGAFRQVDLYLGAPRDGIDFY